jgi:hypothetical protein
MDGSVILPVWRSGDVDSLPDVLTERVTFSSPVTDYHGRAHAAHMLTLIARVLEDVEQTGQWEAERETVCAFVAHMHGEHMHGEHLQGMLREQRDETGHLVQVTLFMRPYHTLGRAIERMRELLAECPLPRSSI